MKKLILFLILGILVSQANAITKTFTLTWTAPGDDGNVGTATVYDLRVSTDSLALINNWNTCTPVTCTKVTGVPIPHIVGTHETFTFILDVNTGINYYFAIKAADEIPNWSAISNIKTIIVPDTIPPSTINDLNVTVQ